MKLEDLTEDCLVTHVTKGGIYQYTGTCKIKNTEWITGVMYVTTDETELTYVRPVQNFLESFKLVRGK